jgi:hypothetical protein
MLIMAGALGFDGPGTQPLPFTYKASVTEDMIRGMTERTQRDTKWEDTMNECIR